MIPKQELDRFHSCARDAWDHALMGRVLEGYEVLDLGLIWAETPPLDPITWEQSPPEPWSAELIALYRMELVRYVAEHHVLLGSACLLERGELLREAAEQVVSAASSAKQDLSQPPHPIGDLPPSPSIN